MTADIETMAYQGATPWHQIGVELLASTMTNVSEVIKAAGLDWKVELEKIFLNDGREIPNRFAVVRDTDHTIISTVGSDYQPIQNEDAFGVLQLACDSFDVKIETAGSLGKGQRVWMLAKLPGSIEPMPGDRVDEYILILNGHNGSTPYTGRTTGVRVVCSNTLEAALQNGREAFRLCHYASDVAQMDLIERMIERLIGAFETINEEYRSLAEKKLARSQVVDFVNDVLQIEPDEEITDKVAERRAILEHLVWNGTGARLAGVTKEHATAWAAFNAVSEYVDHVRPLEIKDDLADDVKCQRLLEANRSALFGAGGQLKQRALRVALEV